MNIERTGELHRRAAIHAALADPTRLQILDTLSLGDASPSELSTMLAMPSNLVAHHVNILQARGIVVRSRSEGDRRRTYLRLVAQELQNLGPVALTAPRRILFVCTANSARSQLAAALWERASDLPAVSGGTHPADRIAPGTLAAAARHQLDLANSAPRPLETERADGDLIVTVCDLAHEELGDRAALHWSIPDPVRVGNDAAFDRALTELDRRVTALAPRLTAS